MRRQIAILSVSLLLIAALVAACGATPTATPVPEPTHTPRPTFTPAPSRTPTPKNSPTPTITNTPVSTNTPTVTKTNTPKPTNTPRPPTNTPVPRPPTNTPVPPPTPTPQKQFSANLFGTEPNCGVTLVEGTVYGPDNQPKSGVVVWMSDASANYRDGFTFSPSNNGATGAGKNAGWYSIVIQQPGMKKGNWFVVVVDSKAAVQSGSQKELSERFYFDTDDDPNGCKPGGAGRQKWFIDFKQNY